MDLIEGDIYIDKEKLKKSCGRNGYTIKELKEYCKLLNLNISGKKSELAERIINYKIKLIFGDIVEDMKKL